MQKSVVALARLVPQRFRDMPSRIGNGMLNDWDIAGWGFERTAALCVGQDERSEVLIVVARRGLSRWPREQYHDLSNRAKGF